VENVFEVGIAVVGSQLSIEGTAVAGVEPRAADGTMGDGIALLFKLGVGAIEIEGSSVARSKRAGVSSFGGTIALGSSVLECNRFHLDAESSGPALAKFEDRGGNVCGCGGTEVDCQAVTSNLEPPVPNP